MPCENSEGPFTDRSKDQNRTPPESRKRCTSAICSSRNSAATFGTIRPASTCARIAETLIAGMNFGNIEAMVRADDWDGLANYMRGKVEGLIAGGADLILCVSNTLHKPLEAIMAERHVPMLHIADPAG